MVLVCLSHFGFEYFRPFEQMPENQVIRLLTMIASPTFMLISGMMLGLLHHTRPRRFTEVARTLAGRGIFLLTVGHALIVISCIPRMGGLREALTRGFITDAIGVAILLGPSIITRVGVWGRLAMAFVLYVAGTALVLLWQPTGPAGEMLQYVLGGPVTGDERYNFPLLAWLAVYLVGTVIGGWMGRLYLAGAAEQVERGLIRLGAAGIVAAVGIKTAYVLLRTAGLVESGATSLYLLTSPLSKLPPSPAYLLFYGACGMAMTGMLLSAHRRGMFRPAIAWLSDLGRASLFVFLIQFYVFYVAYFYLGLGYTPFWPLYFAVSMWLIALTARWWMARGWNRVFDVTRWFTRAAPV